LEETDEVGVVVDHQHLGDPDCWQRDLHQTRSISKASHLKGASLGGQEPSSDGEVTIVVGRWHDNIAITRDWGLISGAIYLHSHFYPPAAFRNRDLD